MADTSAREHALTQAIIQMNSQLDLPHVLDTFVKAAADLTGAKYSAINILDAHGESMEFHTHGMSDHVHETIGRPPGARGVLGLIPHEGTLEVADVESHPGRTGLPAGHPPLGTFLGTALKVRERVFGYLYLAGKPHGFDDEDERMVLALGAAAAVAIDHAELYERALSREQWLAASQRITTELLADPDPEVALQQIVDAALDLAHATSAVLVLPGVDDAWVMEVTAGDDADQLLGLALPEGGRGMGVIRTGVGVVAPQPPGDHVLKQVKDYGPSLYAPLTNHGETAGLLMLWRHQGAREFDDSDLAIAQRFANQAALALSLTELSHVKNMSALLEERERLADDLHDFVSQELFATAMQIESISTHADEVTASRLQGTLEHVKRAQHEVRGVMGALAGQRSSEPPSQRLSREIIMAQATLGFAPQVVGDWNALDDALIEDATLVDDVVAVVRELLSNVARHAQASTVTLGLGAPEGRLIVRVTDDGIGPSGATERHSGTSNLANRALRRRGTFTLTEARPGARMPGSVAVWNVAR